MAAAGPAGLPRAIVGLGNTGGEYAQTRHNAGFWFVDRLAQQGGAVFRTESKFHGGLAKVRVGNADLWLLKPGTMMNLSGRAVQALAAFHQIPPEEIMIVHDELDLPAGVARLKRGGGHGGHNGLRDIHRHLGEAYLRLRIGIGHPGHRDLVLNYVLGRPSKADQEAIEQAIDRSIDALAIMMKDGWDKAAQALHTWP